MKLFMYIPLLVMFGFSGCGDYFFNETTTSTIPVEDGLKEYKGPGSKWELTLHSYGGFTLKEEESFGISMSGDYALTAPGFSKLNVTTSTNPSLSLSQGYLVEIENFLSISQPLINDVNYTQLIAMIPSGLCHDGDMVNNWIDIKRDINSSSDAIFGTFNYTYDNASAVLSNRFDIIAADLGEENLSSINCNQGIANLTDGRVYMHTSGNALIHTGLGTPDDDSDDHFMLSIPSVNISSIAALADEYIGFVYDSTLMSISPVNLSLSTAGTGVAYRYTDVDNEVLDTGNPINILINQVNQPLDGFVNMGINGAQSRCVAHTNVNASGHKVLLCTGDNPTQAGLGNVFTMLLQSK